MPEFAVRFTNVENAFRELREQLGDEVARAFDGRVLELAENLREATPVDTGTARDSWFVSATVPANFTGEVMAEIFNTTDYIDELNAGTSRQAPARFIETEVLRLFEPGGVIVQRSTRRP